MKKLKVVIRQDLPETNSSSSHSVVINSRSIDMSRPGDEVWNLKIDENGIIRIPGNVNFGWEWERHNDVLSKVQYVAGIFSKGDQPQKKLARLASIIKGWTGAKSVIFEWVHLYNQVNPDYEDADSYYYNPEAPEIDHNSSDIFREIIQSDESIKNFIFNKKSWLFLGNDNDSEPSGYYDVDTEENHDYDAIVRVHIGGKIGDIDFPVENYPVDIDADILGQGKSQRILNAIVFDKDKREPRPKIPIKDEGSDVLMYNFFGPLMDRYCYDKKVLIWGSKLMKTEIENMYHNYPTCSPDIDQVEDWMKKHPKEWITIGWSLETNEFGKIC